MARIALRNRLRKLEQKRYGKPRVARVAVEYAVDATGAAVEPAIREWLSSAPHSGPLIVPDAFLGAYRGILAPRVMLCPSFGTEADWCAAAERQQKELLAVARSRTNTPAEAKADSVGNSDSGDVPAPKRKGEKGARFIELRDGRLFDRETGEFEGG